MPAGKSYSSATKLLTVRAAMHNRCTTDLDYPLKKRRRMGSKTTDSTPISKLGDNLLEQILIRLPNPRFACRSKRVCKRWNSVISSPCFNRRFVSHHKSRTEYLGEPPLLLPSDDPLSSVLSFLPVPDEIRFKFVIWDSFKDLLLCGFQNSWGELGRLFLICNPFTKQWVALPLAPERVFTYRTTEVKLVCKEEVHNSKTLNLGDGEAYRYSEYRFRVLLTHEPKKTVVSHGGPPEQHVFCSTSRTWSKMPLRFHRDAISLNGKLYWRHDDRGIIAQYDPFRSIEKRLPPLPYETRFLSVSRGALYVISEYELPFPYVFRVWRWEEGSKTWTMCHELLQERLLKHNIDMIPELADMTFGYVLAQHSEKPEFFFVKCYRDKTWKEALVYSYNLRTRKIELFADRIPSNVLDRWMMFQPKATCFFTPIPSYNELLGGYKGGYGDLVQLGNQISFSIATNYFPF